MCGVPQDVVLQEPHLISCKPPLEDVVKQYDCHVSGRMASNRLKLNVRKIDPLQFATLPDFDKCSKVSIVADVVKTSKLTKTASILVYYHVTIRNYYLNLLLLNHTVTTSMEQEHNLMFTLISKV